MAWALDIRTAPNGQGAGIAAILVAVILLSFSDALVKLAADRFGLAQIVLLRSLVAGALVAAGCLAFIGPAALRRRRRGWVRARSACLVAMWLCYYAGLSSLSLGLAAACYYTTPVWMALMARLLLGTAIGPRGWGAVGLSLAGVILVVDPAGGGVSPAILLPLAAAAFYALAGTITWSRCREESAGAMAWDLNLCLCTAAAAGLTLLWISGGGDGFALAVWPVLAPADWGLAALLGSFLAIIAMSVALAYRLAPTPLIGVVDTAYLGFAALWGMILFAETPDTQDWLGIGLIAASAIVMSGRARPSDGCVGGCGYHRSDPPIFRSASNRRSEIAPSCRANEDATGQASPWLRWKMDRAA